MKDPMVRSVVGAILVAAVVLIGGLGAPAIPVAIGALVAGALVWWRRGGSSH